MKNSWQPGYKSPNGYWALHNRLHIQATHDHLTGRMESRRNHGLSSKGAEQGGSRQGTCISVIVADLDHFKAVNDATGIRPATRYCKEEQPGAWD